MQEPYPPLYFGGSSEAGIEVAAEHCDVYLTWGEPPADVAQKLATAQAAAAKRGRKFSFGIRLHVIVRETAAEAWAEAERLISHVDEATIAKAQATFARMDSVGQQRMIRTPRRQPRQARDQPEPVGRRRPRARRGRHGAGRRCRDGRDADARVHGGRRRHASSSRATRTSRSAYRFAELVFPLLPLAATTGRERRVASNEGPFGEMLANEPLQLQRARAQSMSRAGTLILRAGPWLVPVALVLAWEAAADCRPPRGARPAGARAPRAWRRGTCCAPASCSHRS